MLSIPVDSVEEFRNAVIDKVHIADAFSVHIKAKASSPLTDAEIIAELYISGNSVQIIFSRDRQRYLLNDRKFEELIDKGGLSPQEAKQARILKIQLEQVNRRFNLLNSIVEDAVTKQSAFIKTSDKSRLVIMEAKKTAEALAVHPSWISRLIKGKYLKIRGRLFPLRDLFISQRELKKKKAKVFLEKLIAEESADIKAGRLACSYSDATITRLLFSRYKVKATRRTVNNWRREINREV
jgi:DNA-directed RNA polymerase specialized sigma54-like protein